MRRFTCAIFAAALGLVSPASAATITALNADSIVGVAPAQVANSLYGNNDGITVAFNEASGVVIEDDITLGRQFLKAGTVVDSHLLYHDRFSGTEYISSFPSFSFSESILAVIVTTLELNATHSIFGAPGSEYLSAYGYFGLETDERKEIAVTEFGVDARFTVNQGFDAVRVLTIAQVPVPAAGFLLLGGLGALGLMRRRRNVAA